ncbi:MAG: GIY-YIG nuclease family protein [Tissierellales bacterium]|nr:GIY-YIG nuclease family protein [Tissierellales bacterium]
MFLMEENTIYLGITHDIKERISSHLSKGSKNRSPIRKVINEGKALKRIFKLTDYIDEREVCELEKAMIFLFRQYKDFNVLNVKRGGDL